MEGFKYLASMYRTDFPDLRVPIEDLIAEGDRVVTRWTARGTHQGEIMGIPPTDKQVEIMGITINRLSGGRIEEQWNQFDQLGMLQQLGAAPTLGQ